MFKLKDKVKIINKSYYGKLRDSFVYRYGKKKGVWYVCTVETVLYAGKTITRYAVTHKKDLTGGGDFFLENDLLPYTLFNLLEDELFEF